MQSNLISEKLELKKRADPDPNEENLNQANTERRPVPGDKPTPIDQRVVLGEIDAALRTEGANGADRRERPGDAGLKRVKNRTGPDTERAARGEQGREEEEPLTEDTFFLQIKEKQEEFFQSRRDINSQIGRTRSGGAAVECARLMDSSIE